MCIRGERKKDAIEVKRKYFFFFGFLSVPNGNFYQGFQLETDRIGCQKLAYIGIYLWNMYRQHRLLPLQTDKIPILRSIRNYRWMLIGPIIGSPVRTWYLWKGSIIASTNRTWYFGKFLAYRFLMVSADSPLQIFCTRNQLETVTVSIWNYMSA